MTRLLLAALLMGCAVQAPQETRAEVRDCITGGEPSNTAEWLELTLECTSNEGE